MFDMNRTRPDWNTDGQDWPNRETSQFVRQGAIRWHVQVAGPETAPTILLLHGTGSASHSFRDILPILAQSFRVIVPDLPGHGFTDARSNAALSLRGMVEALLTLCAALEAEPVFGAGHSAGAAVLLQMAQDSPGRFQRVIGINAALEPIEGNAVFSPLAKLFFANPLIPYLFAKRAASGDTVRSLLKRTGSDIDAHGIACYQILTRNRAHVAGALGMMASWELAPLKARMPGIALPVTLIVAEDDPMVPPSDSRNAAEVMPDATVLPFPTGGHLLHEVDTTGIARTIHSLCEDTR